MNLIDRALILINGKKCDNRGNSKECYKVCIDNIWYALLVYDYREKDNIYLSKKKKAIDELVEQGLNTPRILEYKFANQKTYELQECALGVPLGVKYYNKNDIDSYEYTLNTLKILSECSVDNYIKVFESNLIIYQNYYAFDNYMDNFYIDYDGKITFIDIDTNKPIIYIDASGNKTNNISNCVRKEELIKRNFDADKCILFFEKVFSSFAYFPMDSSMYIKFKDVCSSIFEKCIMAIDIFLNKYHYSYDHIKECMYNLNYKMFLLKNDERQNIIENYLNNKKIK